MRSECLACHIGRIRIDIVLKTAWSHIESRGERAHWFFLHSAHQPDDNSRIDPTAKKRAERDIADQTTFHCLLDSLADGVPVFLKRGFPGPQTGYGPITSNLQIARVVTEPVGSRQFFYTVEHRMRRGDIAKRQITLKR